MGKDTESRQMFTFDTAILGTKAQYFVENTGPKEIDPTDYIVVGEALLRGTFEVIPEYNRGLSEGADCFIYGQTRNRLYSLLKDSVEINRHTNTIRCHITGKGNRLFTNRSH